MQQSFKKYILRFQKIRMQRALVARVSVKEICV